MKIRQISIPFFILLSFYVCTFLNIAHNGSSCKNPIRVLKSSIYFDSSGAHACFVVQ